MDHNLEDSLNLDSAVHEMGFEHGDAAQSQVESQVDISLATSGPGGDIPMEFEHIELMDTGNEEIIDFMGDQFTSFQEYSVQDEQNQDAALLVEANQVDAKSAQSESMIDFKLDPPMVTSSVTQDNLPKIVSVKTAIPAMRTVKKLEPPAAPRQVAIAPKPSKLGPPAPFSMAPKKAPTLAPKPTLAHGLVAAPKPVALVANRGLAKKVALSGILQGNPKGTVLAQIGQQLVMVRGGVEQKLKLVSAGQGAAGLQYVAATNDQAQLIATKPVTTSQTKPVMAKVIVQSSGQAAADTANQPAVLTRLAAPRYVMQQRTVPIPLHNQLLLASPTKQGVKATKKQQIIAIKSPTGKLVAASSSQVPTTKKVLITANPSQNVILKTTAPKTTLVNKDGTVVTAGQRTQLHQINVPGKGIQYIRLVTNQNPVASKPAAKQATLSLPSKNFVLTDAKGNIIQMAAEKVGSEPPGLLALKNANATRIAAKPQKKLVRIAPVPAKLAQASTQPRASQSLLAPLSPAVDPLVAESMAELLVTGSTVAADRSLRAHEGGGGGDAGGGGGDPGRGMDTKDALRALVAETVSSSQHNQLGEVEIEFEDQQNTIEADNTNSMDADDSSQSQEPALIVIPSNYGKDDKGTILVDDSQGSQMLDESNGMVNVDGEIMRPYLSPMASQPISDTDYVSNELGLRPRKACNCTKSQCLKLYCDCFANGEFCNRCNCNNCHNNLENEELRQKAIRACLDRNPNAFRPKIGKTKSGGPDIIRRHNKGCNCKRSGCLKNYCECYEAKIACTAMCKCVGCRNVEDALEWRRDPHRRAPPRHSYRDHSHNDFKQPCSFMTTEVIEAVCQCLLAAAAEDSPADAPADPVSDVIDEFARCLQDIISASYQAIPLSLLDEGQA